MTYYLTAGSLGVATERTPMPDNGKVILTFLGEAADSVSVCGKFYPIVAGRAEIPSEAIGTLTEVTAHTSSSHRRYACEPLGRVGDRGETIAVVGSQEALLARIAALLSAAVCRLDAAEARLLAHDAAITRKPIAFGGTL